MVEANGKGERQHKNNKRIKILTHEEAAKKRKTLEAMQKVATVDHDGMREGYFLVIIVCTIVVLFCRATSSCV